jgi:hypothetical protein
MEEQKTVLKSLQVCNRHSLSLSCIDVARTTELSPEKRAAQDPVRGWARDSAGSTYLIYYLHRRIKLDRFRF